MAGVHEESYKQYSGPRMGTGLEYMRNPINNIQVPGWVQGWSTWGILCTIFRSQDGYRAGVHEKSYVQYSGPRMGTGLEYIRNPMYNIHVPGWVHGWSKWGILWTIFRSQDGYRAGVQRNQPFLELTEDITFEPLPTVLNNNTGRSTLWRIHLMTNAMGPSPPHIPNNNFSVENWKSRF